ncbi:MAG: hypothetical protein JWN32_2627 [Solirubrobacterales bacterium]|jgi:hypothetical protein|nr:hypothetical protein [Solirubrobacterales bacterium]
MSGCRYWLTSAKLAAPSVHPDVDELELGRSAASRHFRLLRDAAGMRQ